MLCDSHVGVHHENRVGRSEEVKRGLWPWLSRFRRIGLSGATDSITAQLQRAHAHRQTSVGLSMIRACTGRSLIQPFQASFPSRPGDTHCFVATCAKRPVRRLNAVLSVRCTGHTAVVSADRLPDSARRALAHVASLSRGPRLDAALRVTLNFHPDRSGDGQPPILAALAEQGVYRSQFVTGTSNGGLTAYPGGERWRWESRMFAGAYDTAHAVERPVYGALNYRRRSVGAAPRFGSAHFVLTARAHARTTFCYPDSNEEPTHFGVAERMGLVSLALAENVDALDDHIEAQVHGEVRLDRDVEALVLDPSYRGTQVEELASELPCAIGWHGGFRLTTDELARHPGYRGPRFVALGRRIAVNGLLTPRIIGEALHSRRHDPQDLKRVWHYLARFGAPCDANAELGATGASPFAKGQGRSSSDSA